MKKIGESNWYTSQPQGTVDYRGVVNSWKSTLLVELYKADAEVVKNILLKLRKEAINVNSNNIKRKLYVPINLINLIFSIELFDVIDKKFNIVAIKENHNHLHITDDGDYFEITVINKPMPKS